MPRSMTRSDLISANKISNMHGTMAREIHSFFANQVQVVPLMGDTWQEIQIGDVRFHLVQASTTNQIFIPHTSEDSGGPVVELELPTTGRRKLSNLRWWIGWSENWVAKGARKFQFNHAGLRLYFSANDDDPILVIRAEWQHFIADDNSADLRTQSAAQPHWHVHRLLEFEEHEVDSFIEDFEAPRLEELNNLSPAGTAPAQPSRVDTHRVHLGMGGWTNHMSHPQCWQFGLGDEACNTLRGWMKSVLAYLHGQLPYVDTR